MASINRKFILASPEIISDAENYKKRIPAQELEKINAETGDFEFWFVMVVKDTLAQSTVNLKSPVVINPANASAMQIILEDDLPVRCYVFADKKGEME
jgi:flagellar assembly factor FliW